MSGSRTVPYEPEDGDPTVFVPPPGPDAAPADGGARYALERLLGRGGMGEVLLARDLRLGRRVALKRIRSDAAGGAGHEARFVEEARITARLDHPHVVPIHELGSDDQGRVYYSMKEVRGRDLASLLSERRTPLPALLRIFVKVADAVAFAHDRGILHRDLKPANVMAGDFGEVYVVDWGLARALEGAAAGGEIVGTPAYMSPEAREGRPLDVRSDVYLLGGILRDMLASVETAPRELTAVVEKALASDPARRYGTASGMRADVEAYLDGRLVGAATYRVAERPGSSACAWATPREPWPTSTAPSNSIRA